MTKFQRIPSHRKKLAIHKIVENFSRHFEALGNIGAEIVNIDENDEDELPSVDHGPLNEGPWEKVLVNKGKSNKCTSHFSAFYWWLLFYRICSQRHKEIASKYMAKSSIFLIQRPYKHQALSLQQNGL